MFGEFLNRTSSWRLDAGAPPVRVRSGPIRAHASLLTTM